MPAFGQDLTVQNIWDVVNFLYTIPNGSLKGDNIEKPPTMNQYIQWQASPQLVALSNSPIAGSSQGSTTVSTPAAAAFRQKKALTHKALIVEIG